MKQSQITDFLLSVDAQSTDNGWFEIAGDRHVMLCVAHNGVGLNVAEIEAIRTGDEVVWARTRKGETYQLMLEDVFATAAEAPEDGDRKAGFIVAGRTSK